MAERRAATTYAFGLTRYMAQLVYAAPRMWLADNALDLRKVMGGKGDQSSAAPGRGEDVVRVLQGIDRYG